MRALEPEVSVRPQSQVPVDCDEVPVAAATSSFAHALSFEPPSTYAVPAAAQEQEGTLSCFWSGGQTDDHDYVRMSLLVERHVELRSRYRQDGEPLLEAEAAPTLSCSDHSQDESTSFQCEYGAVRGDYMVRGMFWGYLPTDPGADAEAATRTAFDPVLALLVERPVPELWSASEGSLPLILDCAFFDSVDVAGVVGATLVERRDDTGLGEDHSVPREIASLGGLSRCMWLPDLGIEHAVRVEVLASGAWAVHDQVGWPPHASRPVEIPGADIARLQCDVAESGPLCHVDAAVGFDAVRISAGALYAPSALSEDQILELARQAVAAVAAA